MNTVLSYRNFYKIDKIKQHSKNLHISTIKINRTWTDYSFTGNLRPWPLGNQLKIPNNIIVPDYAYHKNGYPYSEIQAKKHGSIVRLSNEEIKHMNTVSQLAREVLDMVSNIMIEGTTSDQINQLVHMELIKRNCYPSPLNYRGFPRSVCVSVNEVACHGIPDQRPFQIGDIVNVDITAFFNGFHGDLSETFMIGDKKSLDKNSKKLVEVSYECLMKAIEICKPGIRYKEIGLVIEKHATSNGFSVVRSYCGHGINRHFHCPPMIFHYENNESECLMEEGHVFTIEPIINMGTMNVILWPDDWTVVTEDGLLSSQFEHTIAITSNGYDIMTSNTIGKPYFQN